MIEFIKRNITSILLSCIIGLLIINMALAVHNRSVMVRNNELQRQTEEVRLRLGNIFGSVLRRIDLGLRGYALTKKPQLLVPYDAALNEKKVTIYKLDSLFLLQKLDTTIAQFEVFKIELDNYIRHAGRMKSFIEKDDLPSFIDLLNQDKGFELAKIFKPINDNTLRYENALLIKAQQEYESTLNESVLFQMFIILLGVPTILTIIIKLRKNDKNRQVLLMELEKNNKKHLFNRSEDQFSQTPLAFVQNLTQDIQQATAVIKDITQGNYHTQWNGLTAENKHLNEDNLAGHLMKMRDEMKKIKKDDQRRLWITEGLSTFSEIVRNHQQNIEDLANQVIKYITKYLNAQQGSFFIHRIENEEEFLEMTACVAFDRKKFINKKIEIGTGLVGQAFLEGNTSMLTQLPKGYTHITSGLGDATPSCLLIVPLKYNNIVNAVIELAAFKKFEKHEIDFMEKAGEFVAAAIHYIKTAESTAHLLKQAQEQTQMLQAQEEEIRQNMEEMMATHEQTSRQRKERTQEN